jgi:hypothetical protein
VLCSSAGFLPYVGCEYLQPFSGLLQQQQQLEDSVPSGEGGAAQCRRFSMHCFGKQPGLAASGGSSLLGLLAHSTWHTLLKKQTPPCHPPEAAAPPAAAAAPHAHGVGQLQTAPAAAAAPALQQQYVGMSNGAGVAAGVVAC